VGDTGVGKSCLTIQYIEKKAKIIHDITIGVEFLTKYVRVEDKTIKLQIWDTVSIINGNNGG
jgi:Ras-related protein Rab-2A